MKVMAYFANVPIEFMTSQKFVRQMKTQMVDSKMDLYYYTLQSPVRAMASVNDQDRFPDFNGSELHAKPLREVRNLDWASQLAAFFPRDAMREVITLQKCHRVDINDLGVSLSRFQLDACKKFRDTHDRFVRLDKRTWLLTRAKDWSLILSKDKLRYTFINTKPERSLMLNVTRHPGAELFNKRFKTRKYEG